MLASDCRLREPLLPLPSAFIWSTPFELTEFWLGSGPARKTVIGQREWKSLIAESLWGF